MWPRAPFCRSIWQALCTACWPKEALLGISHLIVTTTRAIGTVLEDESEVRGTVSLPQGHPVFK